jgi:hypothetical protein
VVTAHPVPDAEQVSHVLGDTCPESDSRSAGAACQEIPSGAEAGGPQAGSRIQSEVLALQGSLQKQHWVGQGRYQEAQITVTREHEATGAKAWVEGDRY